MLEIVDDDQKRVSSDLHNSRQVINAEQYLSAQRSVAGVIDMMKDKRKLESKLEETLKMDTEFPAVERVHAMFWRFEAYVRRSQLGEVIRPGGR